MIEKIKKNPEKIEKVAREDHDKTGLVRHVWEYDGPSTCKRYGKRYESWVTPEIDKIYKAKIANNKPSEPKRCPVEVK